MTIRSLALIAVVVGTPPAAIADDAKPAPGSEAARQRAGEHYQRGLTHYNLGEFQAAITEFKAAYELSQEPDLLFNIAQAYRLTDDYKQALFFYDAYLRLRPQAPNRADVEARIAATRKLLDDQQRLQQAPPQGALPLKPAVDPRAADPSRAEPLASSAVANPTDRSSSAGARARKLEHAGMIVGGGGIVLSATGTYFALRARSGWNEITALSRAGGTWSEHHANLEADARRSERLAMVLGIGGGAVAVTGAVLWYLGWREIRGHAVVVPTDGGAAVGWSWQL